MGSTLTDPRPCPTVPRWRIAAGILATVLVLWISNENQTDTTATSPDPTTQETHTP